MNTPETAPERTQWHQMPGRPIMAADGVGTLRPLWLSAQGASPGDATTPRDDVG